MEVDFDYKNYSFVHLNNSQKITSVPLLELSKQWVEGPFRFQFLYYLISMPFLTILSKIAHISSLTHTLIYFFLSEKIQEWYNSLFSGPTDIYLFVYYILSTLSLRMQAETWLYCSQPYASHQSLELLYYNTQ